MPGSGGMDDTYLRDLLARFDPESRVAIKRVLIADHAYRDDLAVPTILGGGFDSGLPSAIVCWVSADGSPQLVSVPCGGRRQQHRGSVEGSHDDDGPPGRPSRRNVDQGLEVRKLLDDVDGVRERMARRTRESKPGSRREVGLGGVSLPSRTEMGGRPPRQSWATRPLVVMSAPGSGRHEIA